MPNVYLLLSRTDTLFARAMHGLTGNRYTHVSLALDRALEQMYSFARRYEIAPLPAGFIRENLYDGVYGRSGTADSLVLELPVSQKAYDRIARRLEKMERRQLDYGYDVLGLALAWLGIAHQRRNKFVCSQFVAQTLQKAGALELPDHPSLVRPEDFAYLPGAAGLGRPCGPPGNGRLTDEQASKTQQPAMVQTPWRAVLLFRNTRRPAQDKRCGTRIPSRSRQPSSCRMRWLPRTGGRRIRWSFPLPALLRAGPSHQTGQAAAG